MGRLVRDDRMATVTQITTRYNQGMQNTISERTTRRTLKQMVYFDILGYSDSCCKIIPEIQFGVSGNLGSVLVLAGHVSQPCIR